MALHLYTTHDNDTLVALVNTVYAPAGDSRIRFFNSAWRELPASKYIELPTRDDFFLFPDSLSKVQREELMQARFKHATAQLEKTSELKAMRRQVARISTILNQKD